MGRTRKRVQAGVWAASLLALVAIGVARLAAQNAGEPADDVRNTNIVTTNTHMPLPDFTDLKAWELRKAFLRNQILVSTGLSPMPEKTPLHPQVFGKIEGRGYTIEKVLIETLPGYYLGGNLYRPRNGQAKHPAVLTPHGHWAYGRLENQPIFSGPSLGISLARQGYVVFAFDMVGYTDTLQVPHRFGSAEQRLWGFGPLGLQLWNAIRSLDFAASLDDVDTNRIGITGASGGASQAFLLTAIDDRIQFSSPVNMVSAIMQGGDLCENAPGLRLNTSNVEIAAMFAPKPMLLVSDTTDWTRNVPNEEYPAIKRIYDLYGKGDEVEVVQIEAPHNFNRQSREAVYKFFAKVNPGLSDERELAEHNIAVPMLGEMMATANHPLPPNAVDLRGLFAEWRAMAAKQNAEARDAEFLRIRMRHTLAVEIPDNVIAEIKGESIMLSLPGWKSREPGVYLAGKGPIAIVIDPQGSAAALKSRDVSRLRDENRPVLALDLFQTGAAIAPRDREDTPPAESDNGIDDSAAERRANAASGGPKFLTFNVTDDQARVQDILTAIVWARKNSPDVEIYATGEAALWATFAAAVSPIHIALHLSGAPSMSTDADYLEHFNVPGILRAGGLPAAVRLEREP